MNRTLARAGTLLVALHAVVNAGHAVAHWELGVQLSPWQGAFVLLVIVVCPILAAVLLWTAHARLGAVALAGSMTGAALFGVYFHYVAVSPDHVAYLPEGNLQWLFRSTALLLVVLQVLGAGIGVWGSAGGAGLKPGPGS